VVRRIARAFNKGDVDAIVAELDPNVEWEEQPIRASIPFTTATRASGAGLRAGAGRAASPRRRIHRRGRRSDRLYPHIGRGPEQRGRGSDARADSRHLPGGQSRAAAGMPNAPASRRSRGAAGVAPRRVHEACPRVFLGHACGYRALVGERQARGALPEGGHGRELPRPSCAPAEVGVPRFPGEQWVTTGRRGMRMLSAT
jgi:hypothetical protein